MNSYQPASAFLCMIAADDVMLSGSDIGDANLCRLLALVTDEDVTNRDWATFLIAGSDLDAPEIRAALLLATNDVDAVVRAEALRGLAARDPAAATPKILQELAGDSASVALFEAAILVADPVLVAALRPWTETSDFTIIDEAAREALAACIPVAAGMP